MIYASILFIDITFNFYIPNKTIVVDYRLFLKVLFSYGFVMYLLYKLIIY